MSFGAFGAAVPLVASLSVCLLLLFLGQCDGIRGWSPRALRRNADMVVRYGLDDAAMDFVVQRFGEARAKVLVERFPGLLEELKADLEDKDSGRIRYATPEVLAESLEKFSVRPSLRRKAAAQLEQLRVTNSSAFALNFAALDSLGVDVLVLLTRRPRAFNLKHEKLLTKLHFMEEVLGKRVAAMTIGRCPSMLTQSVEENMKPSIEFLSCFLGGDDDRVREIVRATSGRILLQSLEGSIKPKLAFLQTRLMGPEPTAAKGASDGEAHSSSSALHRDVDSLVRWLVTRSPGLLTRSISTLGEVLDFLEFEALGKPEGQVDGAVQELWSSLSANPQILTTSVRYNLEPTVKHYRALGYTRPLTSRFLTVSLGKRLIPRGLYILRNKVDVPPITITAFASDQDFLVKVHSMLISKLEKEADDKDTVPEIDAIPLSLPKWLDFVRAVEDAWKRRVRLAQWADGRDIDDQDFQGFLQDAGAVAAMEAGFTIPDSPAERGEASTLEAVNSSALFLHNWQKDGVSLPVVFEDQYVIRNLEDFVPFLFKPLEEAESQ